MRKPILAGNWKLNKTPAEAVEFVRALQPKLADYVAQVETVVCPPFVCLPAVADALAGGKSASAPELASARRTCTGPRTARTPARCQRPC